MYQTYFPTEVDAQYYSVVDEPHSNELVFSWASGYWFTIAYYRDPVSSDVKQTP
jgi:hypothetical protein